MPRRGSFVVLLVALTLAVLLAPAQAGATTAPRKCGTITVNGKNFAVRGHRFALPVFPAAVAGVPRPRHPSARLDVPPLPASPDAHRVHLPEGWTRLLRHPPLMAGRLAVAAVALAALASGCGDDEGDAGSSLVDPAKRPPIHSLAAAPPGEGLLLGTNRGLYRIDGDTVTRIPRKPRRLTAAPVGTFLAFTTDGDGLPAPAIPTAGAPWRPSSG